MTPEQVRGQAADAKTRRIRWSHPYRGNRETCTAVAREAAEGTCGAVLPEAHRALKTSPMAMDSEWELAFQRGRTFTNRYVGHTDAADLPAE